MSATPLSASAFGATAILTGDGYPGGPSADFMAPARTWPAKAEAGQPMGQLVKPDQVAAPAADMLSRESGVLTGALVDYDQNVVGAYPE